MSKKTSVKTSLWRAWWICLVATVVIHGMPVLVGSSLLPTPSFPHRTDGSRQPAFNAGYDTFSFRYFDLTYREMARQSLAEGELPLWNPHSWFGLPIAAQYQNQVFSPLEWLDWLGGNRWWNITLLLRIALAGFGTFLLARRLYDDDTLALVAGLLYTCSAYFAGFQSVAAFINGAVLLPWLFLAVDCAFRDPRWFRSAAFLGIAFGLAALTGQPQIAILNFSAAAVVGIAAIIAAPSLRQLGRGGVALVMGGLAAFAIASPQLAAFYEGLAHGYTIHPPGSYSGGATSPLNLLIPLQPQLLGPFMSPWLGRLFPGQINHEAFPFILGAAGALGLGLGIRQTLWAAGVKWRDRLLPWALLIIFAAVLTCIISASVGGKVLWAFPVADRINLPRYSAPLLALIASLFVAQGFHAALRLPRYWLVAAALVAIGGLVMLHLQAGDALRAPLEETNAPLRLQSLVMAQLISWTSLIVVVLLIAFRRKSPEAVLGATGLLVAAELSLSVRLGFTVSFEWWRLLPWGLTLVAALAWAWERRLISGTALGAAAIAQLVLCIMAPRFLEKARDPFTEQDERITFLQTSLGPGSVYGRVLTSQWIMIPNVLAVYDIAQINGINPLQPDRAAQWFRNALADRDLNYTLPVSWYGMVDAPDWPGWSDYAAQRDTYNFLGVRFLVESSRQELSALDLPDLDLVLDTPQYRILEDRRAWPRTFLVRGGLAQVASDSLPDARRDRSMTTFTVDAPAEILAVLNQDRETAERIPVSHLEISPHGVLVNTTHPEPALLVLTDVSYPGWHVRVNGASQPIRTVNGVVRGVELPAGDNQVEFYYRPAWLIPSLLAAGGGWLLVLILVGLDWQNRRRSNYPNSALPSQPVP